MDRKNRYPVDSANQLLYNQPQTDETQYYTLLAIL